MSGLTEVEVFRPAVTDPPHPNPPPPGGRERRRPRHLDSVDLMRVITVAGVIAVHLVTGTNRASSVPALEIVVEQGGGIPHAQHSHPMERA